MVVLTRIFRIRLIWLHGSLRDHSFCGVFAGHLIIFFWKVKGVKNLKIIIILLVSAVVLEIVTFCSGLGISVDDCSGFWAAGSLLEDVPELPEDWLVDVPEGFAGLTPEFPEDDPVEAEGVTDWGTNSPECGVGLTGNPDRGAPEDSAILSNIIYIYIYSFFKICF